MENENTVEEVNEIKIAAEKEKEIGKKFLPIGTVVLLKGGTKELMIISYCIFPAGEVYDKNGPVEDVGETMFEYGGCVYPEGMVTSDQLYAFNHDQIEKVLYRGYDTDKQKTISTVLLAAMEEREKKMHQDISEIVQEMEENEAKEAAESKVEETKEEASSEE